MPRIPFVVRFGLATLLMTGFAFATVSSVQVVNEDHHDLSPPLRTLKANSDAESTVEFDYKTGTSSVDQSNSVVDSVLQYSTPSALAGTIGKNFGGLSYAGASGSPPDPNGSAGATQYVQWVNSDFGVFNKSTGSLVYGPAKGNIPWNGFGGPCQNTNADDGIILYDRIASRWVISRHAGDTNGRWYQCVAVSTTSDATGSYRRYSFQLPNKNFPDYPKLGVWPDAYYLSVNQLSSSNFQFLSAEVCAIDRKSMLNGTSASMQCFQLPAGDGFTLLPASVDGPTLPPSGSPNFLMNLLPNLLQLWKFHVNFQTPAQSSLTGPVKLAPASFSTACNGSLTKGTGGFCIPQLGTSEKLDSLSEEGLMYRLAYRNFGSYDSIVVTHAVGSPSKIRWYEVRNLGSSPTIYQQGTYSPDSKFRWMSSAAMDKMGNIAIGYSVSSNSIHPGIVMTGRISTDPLGTLESEITVINGTGSQTGIGRWGDYTSMSVDPSNDCTFWYTNEYLSANGENNWKTRIASFQFSNCQ